MSNKHQNKAPLALYFLDQIEKKRLFSSKYLPNISALLLEKAMLYEQLGEEENFIKCLKTLISGNVRKTKPIEILSHKLFEKKNYQEAGQYVDLAIKNGSHSPDIYEMASRLAIEKKKYSLAFEHINKAIELKGEKSCQLMEVRFLCLFYQNKFQEAIDYLKKIDKDFVLSLEVRAALGTSYMILGKTEKALSIYSSFLDKHINNFSPVLLEARFNYSDLLIKKQKISDSIKQLSLLEKARLDNPHIPDKRKRLEVISKSPELMDLFIYQKNEIKQNIFEKSLNSKTSLIQFFANIDRLTTIMAVDRVGHKDGISSALFWFYFGFNMPGLKETQSYFLPIENLLGKPIHNFHVYHFALFDMKPEASKMMMENFKSYTHITGSEFTYMISEKNLAVQ